MTEAELAAILDVIPRHYCTAEGHMIEGDTSTNAKWINVEDLAKGLGLEFHEGKFYGRTTVFSATEQFFPAPKQ